MMNFPREATEWNRTYWFDTDQPKLPRVLLIGDSIVVGYHLTVKEQLTGTATLSFHATSKCVGDPDYMPEVANALQQYHCSVIHFNNGLHGFEVEDDDYARYLREFVPELLKLAPDAKMIWASSTPITIKQEPATLDPEKNPRVIARNHAAAKIMRENKIPVNDLYAAAHGRPELSAQDAYHYNETGNAVLGQAVANAIRPLL